MLKLRYFFLILTVISQYAFADSCSVYFPDTVQGHLSGSKIKFEDTGKVIGDIDNILTFPSLSEKNKKHTSNNTCNTTDCTASGSYASALTLPAFQTTSSTTDVSLHNTSEIIGPDGDYNTTEIRNLTVNGTDIITFSATATEYIINNALFTDDAKITFTSGTYWFNELEILGKTQIFINGSVTIFVNGQGNHFDIENNAKINEGGAAETLALISYSDTHLKKDVSVNAVLYSVVNNIHIKDNAHLTGAISSAGEVKIKGTGKVTYQNVSNVTIGTLCSGTPVVVDHYEIAHDAAASVCAAESVTIKACADSSCSTSIAGSVSLEFHTDGLLKSTHNFIGSTTINFNHSDVETLTLSVDSPSITPDNPLVCNDGSGNSCDIVFSSGGCSLNSCAAYFPDTIQGHQAGSKIEFEDTGQVIGDSDNILTFSSLSEKEKKHTSNDSCNTTDCTASGLWATPLTLPDFQTTLSTTDIFLNNATKTIGPGGDYNTTEVRDLVVDGDDIITFLATATEYKIDDALFKGDAKITFNSGTYWFNELEIKGNTQIFINGSVTIYVNGQAHHFDIEEQAKINEGGSADALALVSYSDTHLKKNVIVNAVLYSVGNNIEIKDNAHFTGAISTVKKVKIKGTSIVTYQNIDNVKIGTLCGETVLSLHHFEIVHDGTGLTCAEEPITIKSCNNSDCSVLSAESVSVNFQGNGLTISSPSFIGSTSFSFNHTLAETVTLSLANPSTTPTDDLFCDSGGGDSGGGNSCDLVFADTGFRFMVGGEAINIPTQLSGKPSNIGYQSRILSLQAVKTSLSTGACEAALTSDVTIEFVAECDDPFTCAGQQVTINNGITDTLISTQDAGGNYTYSNISMDFGPNTSNTADFVFTYPDAGKVKLYVRHNIVVDGVPSGNFMLGNSNSFVVRPFGFYVEVDGNTAATDENGELFKKAGENFDTLITAMQWQIGDDDDIDGVPDSNAVLSNNAATPNFNKENSAENVTISHSLVLPKTGNYSALSVNTFSDFNDGISEVTAMNWPEVGIISFSVRLSDNQYIETSNVTGSVPHVGRFIPDHFVLEIIEKGDLFGGNTFVYTGQMESIGSSIGKISYGIDEPEFTITAKSKTDITTRNYTGVLMKLQASDIKRVEPTTDSTKRGAEATVDDLKKVKLKADLREANFTDGGNGVISYRFNDADNYYFIREANAIISPFTTDIDLQITSITDSDGTSAKDDDTDEQNGILTLHPLGVEVRFGRWTIENGFGPETSPIAMPMYVQHWNGSTFVSNELDSFTSFDSSLDSDNPSSGAVISDLMLAPATTTVSGKGTFFEGETRQVVLSPPDPSKQGAVTLGFNVPEWLQYDWDNADNNFDGPYVGNPSATATFGLYRGNDRIIYWREVFR